MIYSSFSTYLSGTLKYLLRRAMATEEAKELSLGASAGFYRVEPSG
jgi:hypothetical protein